MSYQIVANQNFLLFLGLFGLLGGMRAEFILLFALCAPGIQGFAQDDWSKLGGSMGRSIGGVNTEQLYSGPNDPAYKAICIRENNIQILRIVDNKLYNIQQSPLWMVCDGIVSEQQNGLLILQSGSRYPTYTAITNYSGNATDNQGVNVVCVRVGNYDWNGTPIALYDCGTPYIPPPLTPEQIKAAQEAAQIAAQHQNQKQYLAQSNAVIWLQSQATNGDAGAQCSLGEHYLNGQGCETNRERAVYWLKQAADQGDIEASNKLVSLNFKPAIQ